MLSYLSVIFELMFSEMSLFCRMMFCFLKCCFLYLRRNVTGQVFCWSPKFRNVTLNLHQYSMLSSEQQTSVFFVHICCMSTWTVDACIWTSSLITYCKTFLFLVSRCGVGGARHIAGEGKEGGGKQVTAWKRGGKCATHRRWWWVCVICSKHTLVITAQYCT